MTLFELAAEIAREFRWNMDEIMALDRWFITYILFHPRGKYGELRRTAKPLPREPEKSQRELFAEWGKKWGWSDWYCDHRFDLAVAEQEAAVAKQRATGVSMQPGGGMVVTR